MQYSKEKYEDLEMELIAFEKEDVITTSDCPEKDPDEGEWDET